MVHSSQATSADLFEFGYVAGAVALIALGFLAYVSRRRKLRDQAIRALQGIGFHVDADRIAASEMPSNLQFVLLNPFVIAGGAVVCLRAAGQMDGRPVTIIELLSSPGYGSRYPRTAHTIAATPLRLALAPFTVADWNNVPLYTHAELGRGSHRTDADPTMPRRFRLFAKSRDGVDAVLTPQTAERMQTWNERTWLSFDGRVLRIGMRGHISERAALWLLDELSQVMRNLPPEVEEAHTQAGE